MHSRALRAVDVHFFFNLLRKVRLWVYVDVEVSNASPPVDGADRPRERRAISTDVSAFKATGADGTR